MKLMFAAVAMILLTGCSAMPVIPAASGTVTGTVVIGPCRPVERVGDPPCPPRPGIKVHFDPASSSPSASGTAITDAGGAYSIRLPAGGYDAWAEGGIARARAVRVTVQSGQTVTLNLNVDSGIR